MPVRRIQCNRCGISQVETGTQANISELLDLARRIGWTVVHRQGGFDLYCSNPCERGSWVINPEWHHTKWQYMRACQSGLIDIEKGIACSFQWHPEDEDRADFITRKT